MKLRYYLRGLAVGLLLATVILTIANADKRPLTDAQIRARALELGMVDEDSVKLSDLSGGKETEPTAEGEPEQQPSEADEPEQKPEAESEQAQQPSEEGEPEPATDAEAEPEQTTDGADQPETAQQPDATDEPEQKPEAESEQAQQPITAEEPATVEPIVIEIKSGMDSYSVSRALDAAGLVEDAQAYDDYLCRSGYAGTIRTGRYEILPGTSGEDIAKMIAR